MRRMIQLGAVVLGVAVVGGVGLYWYLGRAGGSDLEQWIGRHLVTVIENYIQPEVSFEELDYQAPNVVEIRGVRLTYGDTSLIAADRLRLELAEVPRKGKPIQIRRIELDRPQLQFLTTKAAGLVGWGSFLRPGAASGSNQVPAGQRFSDILVLEHLVIRDGALVYGDVVNRETRMSLAGIELDLRSAPSPGEPGWYRLDVEIRREPVFQAVMASRLNLDSMELAVASLDVTAGLAEDDYESLPPALQRFLKDHKVLGQLSLYADGVLPLRKLDRFSGSIRGELREARFDYGGLTLPLDFVRCSAEFPAGTVEIEAGGLELAGDQGLLFAFDGLTVTLKGIPGSGEPIHIREFGLTRPRFAVRRGVRGGWGGWDELVALSAESRSDGDSTPKREGESIGFPMIILERGHVEDAELTYQAAGMAPLTMRGLQASVSMEPDGPTGRQYRIKVGVQREPWLTSELSGSIHLDQAMVQLGDARMEIDLTSLWASREEVPLGTWDEVKLAGKLTVEAGGKISWREPAASRVDLKARWVEAAAELGKVRLAAERVAGDGAFPQGIGRLRAEGFELRRENWRILKVDAVDVELKAWPGRTEKLSLGRIRVDRPVLFLAEDSGGGFAGWNGGTATPASRPTGVADDPRFASILDQVEFERLELQHGALFYQPIAGEAEQAIKEIDLRLIASGKPPGSRYRLEGTLASRPFIVAGVQAGFDLTNEAIEVQALEIKAQLQPTPRDELSLPWRAWFGDYRLGGKAQVTWSGRVPVSGPFRPEGRLQAICSDVLVAMNGEGRIEAGSFLATVDLPSGPIELNVEQAGLKASGEDLVDLARGQARISAIPSGRARWDIDSLVLMRPKVRLMAAPQGGFRGWNRFLESAAARRTAGEPTTRPAGGGGGFSDRVLLRRLEVQQGSCYLDDADGATEGMFWGGVDATAEIALHQGSAHIHDFNVSVKMQPLARMALNGEWDHTDGILKVDKVAIDADLQESSYTILPPKFQELIRAHEVRGRLSVAGRFELHHDRPRQVAGDARLELSRAHFAVGEVVLPIDQLQVDVTAGGGAVDALYHVRMLSGEGDGRLRQSLTAPFASSLTWTVRDIRLEDTLRAIQGQEAAYSGRLESQGRLEVEWGRLPDSLRGGGWVSIQHARLVRLPILNELGKLVERLVEKAIEGRDSASVDFSFHPDHLWLSDARIKTDVAAVRGSGGIHYDGSLDMTFVDDTLGSVNRRLGPIGDLFKIVEDQVSYEVTGTISEPRVRLARVGPLGKWPP